MSRILRVIFLAAALLSAQQAGLAHALWHAGADRSPDEGQAQLCPLHAALGAACSAVDAVPPSSSFFQSVECAPRAPCLCRASLDAPIPASRGPPALL